MARIGVVVFPGSNCEHDAVLALSRLGADAGLVWHGENSVSGYDALVLPGGFAHGDYVRPGAIARFSPVMDPVRRFAAEGGPVIGICNGFQVLSRGRPPARGPAEEPRPAVPVHDGRRAGGVGRLGPHRTGSSIGRELRIPVNHFEGNYTCDDRTAAALAAEGRVVLRYVDNPNGSVDDIAGVCNEGGNVVGLMPHPERASDPLLGSADGNLLLGALLASVEATAGLGAA